MAICPNCGANIGFSKKCPHCGTTLSGSNESKQTSNIEQIKELTQNFTQKPSCSDSEFQEMVVKFLANASETEKNMYGVRVKAYSENYRIGGTGIINNPVKSEYARSGSEASFAGSGEAVKAATSYGATKGSKSPKTPKSHKPVNKKIFIISTCALLGVGVVVGGVFGVKAIINTVTSKKNSANRSRITLYAEYPGEDYTTKIATIFLSYGEYTNLTKDLMPNKVSGYDFIGYYDDYNTHYFDELGYAVTSWDHRGGNYSLYARFAPAGITITLNNNGGTGGLTSITAVSGENMPQISTLPTKSGYTFNGYWTSMYGGIQYYSSTGSSMHICDLSNGAKLYAHWQSGGSGGSSSPLSYSKSTPGSYGFELYSGYYRSTNYNINSSTAQTIFTFSGSGTVSFKYKISSEPSYDKFSIKHNSTTIVNNISGNYDWVSDSRTISDGDTFTLIYQKDGSDYSNEDRAFFQFTNIANI